MLLFGDRIKSLRGRHTHRICCLHLTNVEQSDFSFTIIHFILLFLKLEIIGLYIKFKSKITMWGISEAFIDILINQ